MSPAPAGEPSETRAPASAAATSTPAWDEEPGLTVEAQPPAAAERIANVPVSETAAVKAEEAPAAVPILPASPTPPATATVPPVRSVTPAVKPVVRAPRAATAAKARVVRSAQQYAPQTFGTEQQYGRQQYAPQQRQQRPSPNDSFGQPYGARSGSQHGG